MERYDFSAIEKKWRSHWQANPTQTDQCGGKPAYYCLDMFPYPSGEGLHVGHWRGYVLSDVLSRYKILQGYHVLHPMGWDAFGLPAENHAIEHGIHPAINTAANIKTFRRQLQEIGAVYDWEREVDTTDPAYYKWTQWIFVQMFKKGLAYEKDMPLNWCPKCKTVLANEEALGGECERCKSTVTKKMLRQWMLKITEYGDRLLSDLENLDWPEKVKKMQSDWIGKSYGAELDFNVDGSEEKIRVFTTRPDTLFGATFMVLSPEHPLAERLVTPEQAEAARAYIHRASTRSSVDRMSDKEKTGVFLGCYALNPFDPELKMPIWISDYVLADYGTGAIMCVPAHDERDFEFAQKFGLYMRPVIESDESMFAGDGKLINSGKWNGLNNREALEQMSQEAERMGIGKQTVNYKLRDWVFSRQRYWGEPIPIIHCPACGVVPVPEDQLPVLLPNVESYQPTETGESPLAAVADWVNTTCPACAAAAKRETNTMPTWAGSSWYFLRYADPHNDKAPASPEALKKWLPVDYYVGGVEHAVLHLLYARFYTKFLYDIGVVEFEEPFTKLFNQGMITRHGQKMSKSKGNGISPDDIVGQYGCDSLRMYELFVGPPALDSDWDDSGIEGVFRYLNRVWKLFYQYKDSIIAPTAEMTRLRHLFVRDITQRLENLSMNTVVSGFMEHTSSLSDLAKKSDGIDADTMDTLAIMLAPFVPHLAEELWQMRGNEGSIFQGPRWPEYDENQIKSDTAELALQVNGRLRGQLTVSVGAPKDEVLAQAKAELAKWLEGGQIVKEIYVPGRIINIVVKSQNLVK